MESALTDAHCHLQDPRFEGRVGAALARAAAAGVERAVCCATREEDWDAVLDLGRAHPPVLPMLGLHPWFAHQAAAGWPTRLRSRLEPVRAGVGECGLDFSPGRPDREIQETAFAIQLRLAAELDRPLAVHCVRAWGRLAALLRAHPRPAAGGLVHAFSGSPETALELQRLGFYLSFAALDGRNDRSLAAVAADRLLLETDAPYGRAEPAETVAALEAAARIRQADPAALAAQVRANGRSLFGRLSP
jgi:TatD DNase family protein